MSTTTETPPEQDEQSEKGLPKIKPPQIVMAVGIAFAAVTVLSGITGSVFAFHGDSDVTREVFGGIPSALKLTFYTVIPVMLVYGA
ncbi:hypothetical protein B7486_59670, partial [cyanobacterium TDX16]